MGAEYLPVACAEPLHDLVALLTAELGVRVHRGHENRRILVVGCLFGGHSFQIDVYIACEYQLVSVIYEDYLAGQMSALTFVYLEIQIAERIAAYRYNGGFGAFRGTADDVYVFRIHWDKAGQGLAYADIWPVQRILFAESVPAAAFGAQTFGGFCTHINPIEQRQKTAVVNIRVRNQAFLFDAVTR